MPINCRPLLARWSDEQRVRSTRPVLGTYPGMVRRIIPGSHPGTGRCMAVHRQGRQHPRHRPHRVRQNPRGVSVGHRHPGRRQPRAEYRRRCGSGSARNPGPVHLTAQGARRRCRAEPACPPCRDCPHRTADGPGRAIHHHRGALGRHPRATPPGADLLSPGHPHHHPGVTVPDADLRRTRDIGNGHHRHRGRGPRGGRNQTRCAPCALA